MIKNLFYFSGIFLLACLFRLTNLDYIEFKTDEAINLLLASHPLFGHPFPYGGTVSSLGVLNPPLFNYILFPLTLINQDPKFISFFIGLINSIAIAFYYLIVKRYYGLSIALISSSLFSLSPWAILFSRKIWMQDLIIPFFIPVFYSIHKLIVEKKSIYWLPYTIFSLFLIQLHQASLIFITILTLFLLFQKTKLNFKYIMIGLLIGLIPLIPYLTYELKNGCPDCSALISTKEKLKSRSLEIFSRPLQIMSQGNFRHILGDDTLTFANKFPLAETLRRVFYLEYIFALAGLLIFIKKYKNFRFLAFNIILLPFAYFILKFEPFMHYFIITIPLLFLFLAVALNFFISKESFLLKNGARILLLLLVIASIAFNNALIELLRERGALKGDYGSSYYLTEREIKNKLKKFEKEPNYNETYLLSFIPLSYVYGYQPLGRMLYSDVTYKEVLGLENDLRESPENPRVKQKLIAFYTKDEPNLENLDLLKEKASNIPQYEPLYKEVLGDYLSKNFKKEYVWHEGGFRFFYPEHWTVTEIKDEIIVSDDNYSLSIFADGNSRLNKKSSILDEIIKSLRPL